MSNKGLIVSVLRRASGGDYSNGGVSSSHTRLTVVGVVDADGKTRRLPADSRVFEPTPDAPPVLLQVRRIGQPVLSIVPADDQGQPLDVWFMFGGNYAELGDSRLHDLTQELTDTRFYGAVAIHDRREF